MDQIKLQKEEERKKQERLKKFKKFFFWLLVVIGIGVVFWGIIEVFSSGSISPVKTELLQIKPSDWVKGNKEAKVVLMEYSDFQCPACSFYYNIINTLMREYGDKMKFVYRHFPLTQIHKNARLAAYAAEAAGKQEKFWQMHDLLFENQKIWSEQNNPRSVFTDYAKSLSLDIAKFETDINSKEVKDKVESDLKVGERLGVNATPTFYLNGKKFDNIRSLEQFKEMIEEAIEKI